jgi:ABC-type sugar transport system substrate-binding protein
MAELAIAAAAAQGLRDAQGRIQLLAIAGDQLTPASIERTAGLHAALARHPDVVLSRQIHSKWTEAEGRQITERYLDWAGRNGVRPGVVWAANDPIAFGAIAALRAAGFRPGEDVFIVGLNWSAPALQRVAEGEMLLTDGGHFLAGGWAMVLLRDHASGLDLGADGTVRFAMSAITRENVERFQRHFGQRDWSVIDFAALSRSLGQTPAGYDFTLERLFRAQRQIGR